MTRPPYPLCWECNGAFQGNVHEIVEVEGGEVAVHKDCAREMRDEGRVRITSARERKSA